MHAKKSTAVLHFRPESCETYYGQSYPSLSADPIRLSVLFGSLGALLAPSCYADLIFSLLLGTSVITACYLDLKPGVHQHSDFRLLLATFVLTTCCADLKPGVHQHNDFGLFWRPL